MPLLLLRVTMIAAALVCVWKVSDAAMRSAGAIATVAHDTVTPFTLVAAGLLIAAVGYAAGKLRR